MPTDHAILAPSAAKRWMSCPPSARLEAQVPRKDTTFSREGTIAHAMAEALLRAAYCEGLTAWPYEVEDLVALGGPALQQLYQQAEGENLDPEEMMLTVAERYCRFIWDDYLNAKAEDQFATLLIEQRLDLGEFIPEGFGSADAVIIYGRTLAVYDLKYGKGVKVYAPGNPQIMCYGLGALIGPAELYDIDMVEMNIIQPRLNWVSKSAMSADLLMSWATDILRPAAIAAYQGTGDFEPGEHCRFCAVAPRCRTLARKASSMNLERCDTELMTNQEIADVLKTIAGLKTWLSNFEANALELALAGTPIPGFKVVEGRSIRQISDQGAAIEALDKAGFDESSYMKPRELKTISDLERLLKKKGFQEILGKYVTKPQGKPVLVEDGDPRPVFNSPTQDFKDIQL